MMRISQWPFEKKISQEFGVFMSLKLYIRYPNIHISGWASLWILEKLEILWCILFQVPGKVNLRGADRLARLQSLNDERENQWLPNQRRNVTYVSRLQGVQAAVDHQLGTMATEHPDRRVGLISFNNEVSGWESLSRILWYVLGDQSGYGFSQWEKRRHYIVTSVIGWDDTQNDSWVLHWILHTVLWSKIVTKERWNLKFFARLFQNFIFQLVGGISRILVITDQIMAFYLILDQCWLTIK